MIVVMNKNYTSEDIDQVVNYIENKNLKEETLLEKDNFREIADRKNDAYFANNF